MPPSGFSDKAIQGLLRFVEGCYEDLLAKLRTNPSLDVRKAIEEELVEIRRALEAFSTTKINRG